MLKAIIIEDERLARENIIQCLSETQTEVEILKTLASVKESIEYLSLHPEADIIFSDVQLPDGLSFSVFSEVEVNIPIIFITAYDQYIVHAFECNGIDYLLKPAGKDDFEKALMKYRMLKSHFERNKPAMEKMMQWTGEKKKSRLIVKKGMENIALLLDEIVFFYTEHKIVYVIDKAGKKYLVDRNLAELESELDKRTFFRANRQYIININFVKGFKAYEKVKLAVDINIPDINPAIIISQETAPEFRRWMYEA